MIVKKTLGIIIFFALVAATAGFTGWKHASLAADVAIVQLDNPDTVISPAPLAIISVTNRVAIRLLNEIFVRPLQVLRRLAHLFNNTPPPSDLVATRFGIVLAQNPQVSIIPAPLAVVSISERVLDRLLNVIGTPSPSPSSTPSPLPSASPSPSASPTPSVPAWIADANTFGLYHFDDTLTDSSGHGNDLGTNQPGTTDAYEPGMINHAYTVSNVSGSRFRIGGNYDQMTSSSQPWTIMLWARVGDIDGDFTTFSRADGTNASIAIFRSGNLGWWVVNNDAGTVTQYPSTVSINDNLWHHIVYRYNGAGVLTVFVDAVERQAWSVPVPVLSTGAFRVADGTCFPCAFDELVVVNRALTVTEIGHAAGL